MPKENWTINQIQSVLDAFSVGKLISLFLLEKASLRIHDKPLEHVDVITKKMMTRKQDLNIEGMVAKSTYGLYIIVITNPVEERQVFLGDGNWSNLFYKKLGLKNAKAVDAQPHLHKNKSIHRFDHYFYLFAL
jgi:hypothetical protein